MAAQSDRRGFWEPLLALADLAGGEWPEKARQAAVGLSARAEDNSVIGALLRDIRTAFVWEQADRLLSRTLVECLKGRESRPWREMNRGKAITEQWLAQQLRPYGIQPRTMRVESGERAKGYLLEDLKEVFRRYIPRAEAGG